MFVWYNLIIEWIILHAMAPTMTECSEVVKGTTISPRINSSILKSNSCASFFCPKCRQLHTLLHTCQNTGLNEWGIQICCEQQTKRLLQVWGKNRVCSIIYYCCEVKMCTFAFHSPGGNVGLCFNEKIKATGIAWHFIINKGMTPYISNVNTMFLSHLGGVLHHLIVFVLLLLLN